VKIAHFLTGDNTFLYHKDKLIVKKKGSSAAIPQESVDGIREIGLLAGLKGFSGKGY